MTRAVLDTNVLAAGLARVTATSAAVQLIDRWLASLFTLVISDHILAELDHTFRLKYFQARLTGSQIDRFFEILHEDAIHVAITHDVSHIAPHPEDDVV